MKDSQYIPGPPKNNNNGDIMSGGAGGGGGGRREESGGSRAGSGGAGYPHWPPHPLHSPHHQFRSHHSQRISMLRGGVRNLANYEIIRIKTIQLPFPYPRTNQMPRMMGGYYGGRGIPPAAAHLASSGGWGRAAPSPGGGGLKPPERWTPVVGPSTGATSQQIEGGMDLSQTRSNGSQPNGVAKEAVSVIAANPLRSGDKPLEPSDRSEDEDEDCMVIEEGEEAPRTGELPPAASRQCSDDVTRQMRHQRDPSIGQEAPALEAPPAAHHNPLRHPSLPSSGSTGSSGRPESSHHLPPSVAQPLRSDTSSPLQKPSPHPSLPSGAHRGDTSSPHQAVPKASPLQALVSKPTNQPESSHHLPVSVQGLQKPASPLMQKPGSPSLTQQALQFAKQILAQKHIQDSILAQQKLNETAYQQLLAQQKLVAASNQEAAHQLLMQQKLQASAQQELFQQRPDLTAVLQAQVPHHKPTHEQSVSSVQLHKPASPSTHPAPPSQSHAKLSQVSVSQAQEGGSVAPQYREPTALQAGQPPQPESLSLAQDARLYQPRHESASLPPNLPINIPSSLQVIAHPVGSCVTGSGKEAVRQSGLDQRPDIGSLPPQVAARLPNAESSAQPAGNTGSLPQATARLPPSESPNLPPAVNDPLPAPAAARLPVTESSCIPTGSTGALPQVVANLPSAESSSLPGNDATQPSPPTATPRLPPAQVGEAKAEVAASKGAETLTAVQQSEPPEEKPVVETRQGPKEEPGCLPGSSEGSVDHVESMLENMFQQNDSPSQTHSIANPVDRHSPALTEDKVVQILQDRDDEQLPFIKQEVKLEAFDEGIIGQVATGSAFMQVESELEKMFAGIVETPGDSDKPETPESSKSSKKSASVKRNKGRPRAKKDLDGSKKKRNKSPHADSLKHKRKLGSRTEKIKEGSNDSSSISIGQMYKWRGPYIKVTRGLDGRPNSVTLVNSGSALTEEDKDKSLDKSIKRKAPRIVEGRTKGPGLYSSTLSSKYNSTIIDVTWTCVFCNRRSHCENGLGGDPAGDLFGPYLVHIKLEPSLGGPSDVDVAIEQRKRGGGKQLSLRAGGKANHSFSPPQKKSRKSSVSDKDNAEVSSGVVSKDVWVHEACAIWAPGVILVGPHLIGLDDAVAISLHSKCVVCGESGACISCLQHGCHKVCHYGCARATQWSLDEETFHAHCLNHKKPITMSLALQQSSV